MQVDLHHPSTPSSSTVIVLVWYGTFDSYSIAYVLGYPDLRFGRSASFYPPFLVAFCLLFPTYGTIFFCQIESSYFGSGSILWSAARIVQEGPRRWLFASRWHPRNFICPFQYEYCLLVSVLFFPSTRSAVRVIQYSSNNNNNLYRYKYWCCHPFSFSRHLDHGIDRALFCPNKPDRLSIRDCFYFTHKVASCIGNPSDGINTGQQLWGRLLPPIRDITISVSVQGSSFSALFHQQTP